MMISIFLKIEAELNCKFPSVFKDYFSKIESEEIILELPDENYRILFSLTRDNDQKDSYEDVVKCSHNHNESYYPEDKDYIKLPFARVLSGDAFKYLYFLSKEGEESNGEIFLRDMDSPKTGRVRVSKNLDLIKGNISSSEGKTIINCKEKSFLEWSDYLTISNNISYWDKNGFGMSSRENTNNRAEIIKTEWAATVYESEDKSENCVRLEINFSYVDSQRIIHSANLYYIEITGLKYSIQDNMNYRIFYLKFICALDCLKKTAESLDEKNIMTLDEFDDMIKIPDLVEQMKSSWIQIDYG